MRFINSTQEDVITLIVKVIIKVIKVIKVIHVVGFSVAWNSFRMLCYLGRAQQTLIQCHMLSTYLPLQYAVSNMCITFATVADVGHFIVACAWELHAL